MSKTSTNSKKTLLSGVKPTGKPHIGNYFGAMKQWVDLQNNPEFTGDKAQKFFMIADYHALNFIQNAAEMKQNIIDLALDYLAIGIDPKQSIIFKQSDISAHTELAWIFDTITTMPYLQRAHAYKDAEAKNKEISVGAFNYPMLMCADILLYDVDIVPVGQDQKQHVEYARDTAIKFNHIFGGEKDKDNNPTSPVFKLPEPMIMESVATVPGLDGRKMSKSYGNTIPLFASYDEIKKAVMSIVTDAGLGAVAADGTVSDGIPKNIYEIHKLIKPEAELKPLYEANKGKYKALKDALVEDLEAFIKPMRERRALLAQDNDLVMQVLADGASRARMQAEKRLAAAKQAVGVSF
ncbi:MAG: Tryptophan--tRNA ligase [Candidatus Taylorbacteria bacterium]|nr:Tryptophan--tRNA ligase [Candidatus Taylorbacteria bacterium]